MTKLLLILITFGVSASSYASTFQCSVEQYDDFAVEINLANGKAAFFDNDNWSVINQKQSVGGGYVFEGTDNYGDPLKVEFNPNKAKQGYLRFREANRTRFSSISCVAVKRAKLNSGI